MGRHSWEHVKERIQKDLAACDTFLETSLFLTGNTPCQADCFLFGQIESVCACLQMAGMLGDSVAFTAEITMVGARHSHERSASAMMT